MRALVLVALLMGATAVAAIKPVMEDGLELVQIQVLNRHGHRAPNGPYWRICPNDAYNQKNYDVVSGGLTDLGFREEFDFGTYLRKTYGKFIGREYSPKDHFFRAVSEPRTMQSALMASQALFSAGPGPKGILPSRPQYPPVFTDLESHEYLLDSLPCIPEMGRDIASYMATRGAAVLNETRNAKALKELVHLCGTKPADLATGVDKKIKVMVDGVIFNHDYGMNVLNGKISKKTFFTLRNMTNALLQGKLYGTDKQATYMSVDFPHDLIRRFLMAREHPNKRHGDLGAGGVVGHDTFQRFSYYCGHREELYGVSHFFDMPIRVPHFPVEELPTGSSFVFKLLRKKGGAAADYVVKVDLWTPVGVFTLGVRACASPHLCTLDELHKIYETRVKRTGTWDKLCKFEINPRDKTFG